MITIEDIPELFKEWDYDKNLMEYGLKPNEVTKGSHKKVYWICSQGHSYEMEINSRTRAQKRGCPYCSGHRVLKGYNDLLSNFPDICKEGNEPCWWDYEKNLEEFNLKPDELTPTSGKKVYWKCNRGHSWETFVYNPSKNKTGCPFCSNKKIITNENDLKSNFPELIKEWDYELNFSEYGLKPEQVARYSHKKVYWKCSNNHSYKMSIASRTQKNYNCPYCSNQKVLKGYNDLLSNFPDICKTWDYEKNLSEYGLKPDEIAKCSDTKVYWKCNNNHSYQTAVSSRTYNKTGCPYCSNQKVLKGYNDLLTLNPEICKEWDYEKNIIKPDEITIGSSRKKIWWKCPNNHSYRSPISRRTIQKSGCPYCSNQKILKGFNDLLTLKPDLCKEWDYELNTIMPDEVMSFSSDNIWWKCSKGHSYKMPISRRTYQESNCPYCANKKILKGFNDLQTLHPDICKEGNSTGWWDYEKNLSEYSLKPDEIVPGSHKKVWWKCLKGHSWKTMIFNRALHNSGCPKCNNKTSFGEQCIYYYLLPYNAKNRFKLDNMEIDVYLPKMNIESDKNIGIGSDKDIGIEFNGEYWHRDKKEKDLIKELKLSHKVKMYYICELDKNEIKGNKIFFNKEKYNLNLEWALKILFNILNLDIDVNIERDKQLIYKNLVKEEKENSLAIKKSELLNEWDYTKNIISPEELSYGSNIKVWWKCSKGHSWESSPHNRLNCPYC